MTKKETKMAWKSSTIRCKWPKMDPSSTWQLILKCKGKVGTIVSPLSRSGRGAIAPSNAHPVRLSLLPCLWGCLRWDLPWLCLKTIRRSLEMAWT